MCVDDVKLECSTCNSGLLSSLSSAQLEGIREYAVNAAAARGIKLGDTMTEEVVNTETTEATTEEVVEAPATENVAAETTEAVAVEAELEPTVAVEAETPAVEAEIVAEVPTEMPAPTNNVYNGVDAKEHAAILKELEEVKAARATAEAEALARDTRIAELGGELTAATERATQASAALAKLTEAYVRTVPSELLSEARLQAASNFVEGFDPAKALADHDSATILKVVAFSSKISELGGSRAESSDAGAVETEETDVVVNEEPQVDLEAERLRKRFVTGY